VKLPLRVNITPAFPVSERTAKKPSPVIARSSAELDCVYPPWLNCWRIARTTVPDPTIWFGFESLVDAITSAKIVIERLKPLVETFARLCEIVDMSVCAAWSPLSEV
jgi:hypothetical protein